MICVSSLSSVRTVADCERAGTVVDNPDVPQYLAAAYGQAGDLERARKVGGDFLRLIPSFTIARYQAKFKRNAPAWHEQQRLHVIPGMRKAGIPE